MGQFLFYYKKGFSGSIGTFTSDAIYNYIRNKQYFERYYIYLPIYIDSITNNRNQKSLKSPKSLTLCSYSYLV